MSVANLSRRAKKYSMEACTKMCDACWRSRQTLGTSFHLRALQKKTLEGWLLAEIAQVADQRKHHKPFSSFFTTQDGLCFCHNVMSPRQSESPVTRMSALFVDCSSRRLKDMLLHNGNKYPVSSPGSLNLKEDYNSIKTLLDALKYDEYSWEVIGDLNGGIQKGWVSNAVLPEFPCHLCLWDTKAHYHRWDWPQWTEFSVGRNNIKWEQLGDPWKVLMPPRHIKLGLMKQFVRALHKESAAFNYLLDIFPELFEAKVKAGVFVGPQIKKILVCSEFPKKLTSKEKEAWNSFLQWFGASWEIIRPKTVELVETGEELQHNGLKFISLMLILVNSTRIWERTQRVLPPRYTGL
ncbi:uncharacterized protein LOC117594834 [Esox lucius]|uniref:uncharacterized protein LOC117594834 n=1 Tax=Esox lucius TaxID=8010 RepID=UPI001477317D|nr:uncharacterized protein LOC117594834 [Esox lucius]